MREYELSETFHHSSDERSYDVLRLEQPSGNNIDVLDGNNALSLAIEQERAEREPHALAPAGTPPSGHVSAVSPALPPRILDRDGSYKTTPENKYTAR